MNCTILNEVVKTVFNTKAMFWKRKKREVKFDVPPMPKIETTQKGVSISNFKRGDVIIRLKSVEKTLIIDGKIKIVMDDSFRQPMEFIAVENKLIYLKYIGGVLDGVVTNAPLEIYCDDWDYFKEPEGLNEIKEQTIMPKSLEPFTEEMYAFLLVNAMRSLTEEQRAGLCFDLYDRSGLKERIDEKIKMLKS